MLYIKQSAEDKWELVTTENENVFTGESKDEVEGYAQGIHEPYSDWVESAHA